MRIIVIGAAALLVGFGIGWWVHPHPPPPDAIIKITGVDVRVIQTTDPGDGTKLRISTRYRNTGCERVLLARFLVNSHPMPAIVLPRQHGVSVLPVDQDHVDEYVLLDVRLTEGDWNLFSVASCYRKDDPMPAADVAPGALFDVKP